MAVLSCPLCNQQFEASRLAGWAVCPACGHVQATEEAESAAAPEDSEPGPRPRIATTRGHEALSVPLDLFDEPPAEPTVRQQLRALNPRTTAELGDLPALPPVNPSTARPQLRPMPQGGSHGGAPTPDLPQLRGAPRAAALTAAQGFPSGETTVPGARSLPPINTKAPLHRPPSLPDLPVPPPPSVRRGPPAPPPRAPAPREAGGGHSALGRVALQRVRAEQPSAAGLDQVVGTGDVNPYAELEVSAPSAGFDDGVLVFIPEAPVVERGQEGAEQQAPRSVQGTGATLARPVNELTPIARAAAHRSAAGPASGFGLAKTNPTSHLPRLLLIAAVAIAFGCAVAATVLVLWVL